MSVKSDPAMKFKYMFNSYKRKPTHPEVYSLSQIFLNNSKGSSGCVLKEDKLIFLM